MSGTEVAAVVSAGAASAGLIAAWVWKISKNGSDQRASIYRRMDEEREAARRNYPSKEVCEEKHLNVGNQLSSMQGNMTTIQGHVETIAEDMKTLLRKNGIHDGG